MLNVYGGIGIFKWKSQTDLLGTYRVTDGFYFRRHCRSIFIEEKYTAVRDTLGANLKLGFFSLNADYTFAEFNSASVRYEFCVLDYNFKIKKS